jgi:beta-N-acetylhexosaminidase
MPRPQRLALAFAAARLAVVLLLVYCTLDWRSPVLASVRMWVLAGLIVLPAALIAAELRTLWRTDAARGVRALSALTFVLAAACLISAPWTEAQFQWQWQRQQVLRADPAQLVKLGRHIVVGYRDIDELRGLVERRAVAGVFIAARNVQGRDAAAIRQEIAAMQEIRRRQGLPPLLIATDQGGSVSRLSPPLAWRGPLSQIVARHSDAAERREAVAAYAAAQARELADLGVNVNFAPVVDLDHGVVNPHDRLTRIHARAIAKDPHIVAEVAETYCAQLSAHGVRCTLKHFPGLGRVRDDTHLQAADLATPLSELDATDLMPFRSLMRRDDVLVMLSHVRLTAIDRERPVSFSRAVVHNLLRTEWGHGGVLITDDFNMGAVYGSPQGMAGGSVEALNAGVDLILISYDVDQFYGVMHALIRADRAGALREDALRQSAKRLERAFGR